MMLNLQSRTQFNSQPLRRKVDQATFRSLGHAGGAIRLTAKRSIRRNKQPSRPGTAPHTPTGMLKRVIRYEVGPAKDSVAIGPINEIAGKLWNLHEFGGVARKRRLLKSHRFSPGDYGPVRVQAAGFNTKFERIRLQTAAQASRATRLVAEENERRSGSGPRRYPARPFMRPALMANRSRLPKFWANSVR
ncbi:MAG: hypothetical protein ACO1RT_02985 [Planctomycetaceae bacterium]